MTAKHTLICDILTYRHMQQVQNDNETIQSKSQSNNHSKLFPWLCICCEQEFSGEPAYRHPWGRLCWMCWMLGAKAEEDEKEQVVTPVEIKD